MRIRTAATRAIAATFAIAIAIAIASAGAAQAGAPSADIPPPLDREFPGQVRLAVDASDVERRIVRVHETIDGLKGDCVLLYPKWIPGWHGPRGPVERLAGLSIHAGGRSVTWVRDPVDTHAFHVHVPDGADALDLQFDYLSPTGEADNQEFTRALLILEWNRVALYPAGFFASRIGVDASLTLPPGWASATALAVASSDGARTAFRRVSLETLVDSPVYAGRHFARIDLDPGASVPVHLDVFADRPEALAIEPAQVDMHRKLVQQAYRLYGSRHFAHYDFLLSLSEQIRYTGLEHHESSSNSDDLKYFQDWDKSPFDKELLAHEFTHSWNGKFRRPLDLSTPNFNVPMQDSLLWVYEGMTEYWGKVLMARSGMWTSRQALEDLAYVAAYFEALPARQWRPLQDTTNDPVISANPGQPSWPSWQRRYDYYGESVLIWLDADTLIRQRSHGQRSLDDFAQSFFGIRDGALGPVTYTFDDVVKALNQVEPYDWAGFLRMRLDAAGAPPFLDGLKRGGYTLVYTDTPSELFKSAEAKRKRTELLYSIGLSIDQKGGTIARVLWDSPAFKAGLTQGEQVIAVDGQEYSGDVMKDAIKAAAVSKAPLELIVKGADRYWVAHIDYAGGLRYPHLERDPSVPALLDGIYTARK